MKNSSDTNGNRNHDLPICSEVPQPTAPPRSPIYIYISLLCYGLHIFSFYTNFSLLYTFSVVDKHKVFFRLSFLLHSFSMVITYYSVKLNLFRKICCEDWGWVELTKNRVRFGNASFDPSGSAIREQRFLLRLNQKITRLDLAFL
jgi:hypothetical protein